MSKMKIAYLGYDFFYECLDTLITNSFSVNWVFTFPCDNKYNFNSKTIELANSIGSTISLQRINQDDITNLIDNGCTLIVVAGYPYRIPCIEGMPKAINIHPSLLPEGRGPWPLPVTILKDLHESGVTIHKVSPEMDAGDILIKGAFKINKNENLETLSCKMQLLGKELLIRLLTDFERYWENASPQQNGTYWPMPTFEDRELDWNLPVREINRVARAFGKFDSLAKFDNKEWIVQDLSVWEENHKFKPGTVVHRTNKEVLIAASDGYVCIRCFQIDPDFIK